MTKTTQRKPNMRERGMPAPPTFSLFALADDTLLTQAEVAGFWRKSIPAVEKARYDETDGLTWVYLPPGWPRCTAGSLKKAMQDTGARRPPVPNNPMLTSRRGGKQRQSA